MRTLWVEGSPHGDQSLSSAAAEEFLASADNEATGIIEHFSVWSPELPLFDRDAAIAKFAPLFGESITAAQQAKWDRIVGEIERVRQFDRLVISSPMWNWSVPYPVKAWIDMLVQPLASFTLDDQGRHVGALGDGKPLHLILTRSSAYDGRHPELRDFQLPYLEYVFTLLGYEVDALVIEPTTRWTADERAQVRQDALTTARERGAELSVTKPNRATSQLPAARGSF